MESAAVFEVATDDPRKAIELVKAGKASLIEIFPGTSVQSKLYQRR
jgi:hypothetical protein